MLIPIEHITQFNAAALWLPIFILLDQFHTEISQVYREQYQKIKLYFEKKKKSCIRAIFMVLFFMQNILWLFFSNV